jgi:hypothetical protein
MKIAFKIPMAAALSDALRAMSDQDAGAAFKAALAYFESGTVAVLDPGATLAFAAMRELIDLSRQKAAAGRAGGRVSSFASRRVDVHAGTGADSPAAGKNGGDAEKNSQDGNQFDVLAGLQAFM